MIAPAGRLIPNDITLNYLNNQKSTTTGVVHTRGRQCVCNFSGFSKRIPSLEHPRVGCTFPIELREVIP